MQALLRQAFVGRLAIDSVGAICNTNLGVINLLPQAVAAYQPLLTTGQGIATGLQERYYASLNRPGNAYAHFVKSQYGEAASRVNGKNGSVVMPELSAMWKGMSDEEKKPYKDAADKALAAYKDTAEYKEAAAMEAQRKQQNKVRRANGYNIFVHERMTAVSAKVKEEGDFDENLAHEAMKRLAATWKSLSDNEKDEYRQKAVDLKKSSQGEASR